MPAVGARAFITESFKAATPDVVVCFIAEFNRPNIPDPDPPFVPEPLPGLLILFCTELLIAATPDAVVCFMDEFNRPNIPDPDPLSVLEPLPGSLMLFSTELLIAATPDAVVCFMDEFNKPNIPDPDPSVSSSRWTILSDEDAAACLEYTGILEKLNPKAGARGAADWAALDPVGFAATDGGLSLDAYFNTSGPPAGNRLACGYRTSRHCRPPFAQPIIPYDVRKKNSPSLAH